MQEPPEGMETLTSDERDDSSSFYNPASSSSSSNHITTRFRPSVDSVDDHTAQSILEEHVSRIWDDPLATSSLDRMRLPHPCSLPLGHSLPLPHLEVGGMQTHSLPPHLALVGGVLQTAGSTLSSTTSTFDSGVVRDDVTSRRGVDDVTSREVRHDVTSGRGRDNVTSGRVRDDVTSGEVRHDVTSGRGRDNVTSGRGRDNITSCNGEKLAGHFLVDHRDLQNIVKQQQQQQQHYDNEGYHGVQRHHYNHGEQSDSGDDHRVSSLNNDRYLGNHHRRHDNVDQSERSMHRRQVNDDQSERSMHRRQVNDDQSEFSIHRRRDPVNQSKRSIQRRLDQSEPSIQDEMRCHSSMSMFESGGERCNRLTDVLKPQEFCEEGMSSGPVRGVAYRTGSVNSLNNQQLLFGLQSQTNNNTQDTTRLRSELTKTTKPQHRTVFNSGESKALLQDRTSESRSSVDHGEYLSTHKSHAPMPFNANWNISSSQSRAPMYRNTDISFDQSRVTTHRSETHVSVSGESHVSLQRPSQREMRASYGEQLNIIGDVYDRDVRLSSREPEQGLRLSSREPDQGLRLSSREPEQGLRLSSREPDQGLRPDSTKPKQSLKPGSREPGQLFSSQPLDSRVPVQGVRLDSREPVPGLRPDSREPAWSLAYLAQRSPLDLSVVDSSSQRTAAQSWRVGEPPRLTNQMSSPPRLSNRASVSPPKIANRTSSVAQKLATHQMGNNKSNDVTVVGYKFCDEEIPYRTTVSGRTVTLGQFKQLLSKRGNFRYFFKKACDEFDSGVVHEEVFCDADVLPLYEDKIFGKLEKRQ